MRITIHHKTQYQFELPPRSGLQRLHLRPDHTRAQQIQSWDIALAGARQELEYRDHFGNVTELVKIEPHVHRVEILVAGVVETTDVHGVMGDDPLPLPLWLFRQDTALTARQSGLNAFIKSLGKGAASPVKASPAFFHEVSEAIRAHVAYELGSSTIETSAEEAWKQGKGVCQDHSHILIAVARALGLPARYASGYLLMDGVSEQSATHAWAELYLDGLGWVGFDVSNGISPDERYVRMAIGRDYNDALPIKGLRNGAGKEALEVSLQIQQ